jgi:hypothetical protein
MITMAETNSFGDNVFKYSAKFGSISPAETLAAGNRSRHTTKDRLAGSAFWTVKAFSSFLMPILPGSWGYMIRVDLGYSSKNCWSGFLGILPCAAPGKPNLNKRYKNPRNCQGLDETGEG